MSLTSPTNHAIHPTPTRAPQRVKPWPYPIAKALALAVAGTVRCFRHLHLDPSCTQIENGNERMPLDPDVIVLGMGASYHRVPRLWVETEADGSGVVNLRLPGFSIEVFYLASGQRPDPIPPAEDIATPSPAEVLGYCEEYGLEPEDVLAVSESARATLRDLQATWKARKWPAKAADWITGAQAPTAHREGLWWVLHCGQSAVL